MTEEEITRMVARGMYLVYCQQRGYRPHREGYVPDWALDYAETAIRMLGYPDDVTRSELAALMVPNAAVPA